MNTGENVTIECTAEGIPVPDVSIYYNDTKDVSVIESSAGRAITALRNITRAEGRRDSGLYSCVADNRIDFVVAKRLNLYVYSKMKLQ